MIGWYLVLAFLYVVGAFQLRPWMWFIAIQWDKSDSMYWPIVHWLWLLVGAGLVIVSSSAGVNTVATGIGVVVVAAVAIRYVPRLSRAESSDSDEEWDAR